MIKLNTFLKEENWKAEKSVITLDGKKVGDYSYDRDSDSFWIDNIKGSGQKSFDTTGEMLSYIKAHKNDYLKARKDYTSKGYVKEETAPEIVKDLDKVKNDLIKKVEVLIAKKKKLYSNVDMTTPMSPEEKQLDKDIQSIFSQIQQIILKKRSLKKEGVSFQQGVVYSNPYHTAFKPQIKEGEDTDYEVSMAQKQLDDIIKSATELKSKMGDDEFNVEAWIQDHIAKSQDYINQANYGFEKNESVKENIIKEATAKLDFAQVGGVSFYVSSPNKNIVLLPQSRKEIEKIDTIISKSSKDEFIKSLQTRLEKKLGISLEQDRRHAGAGYAFDIDTDKLFNKL